MELDVATSGMEFLINDSDLSDPLPDYLTSTGSSPVYSDLSLSPTEHLRASPDYISEITSTNLDDVFESQPFKLHEPPRSKLRRHQTKQNDDGKVSIIITHTIDQPFLF